MSFGTDSGFAPPPGATPELEHWFAQLSAIGQRLKLDLPFYTVTGADTDGVEPATGIIQDVLDTAREAGGGTVFIPEGTFLVDQLTVGKFVNVLGSGLGTILKHKNDAYTQDDSGSATGGTVNTLQDTSKAWTADEHQFKTLHITSGTLAGETRVITTNTTDTLTIGMESGVGSEDFASAVSSGDDYEILDGHAVITSHDNASSHWSVQNLQIDGNKANQTAYNFGILITNDASVVEGVDSHQLFRDLWIQDPSGWGTVTGGKKETPFPEGSGPREILFENVVIHGAGRHSHITWPGGGTDVRHTNRVSADTGFSGFVCNGSGDKWVQCKAFGAGQEAVTNQGAGFLVTTSGIHMYQIYGQENFDYGIHLVNVERAEIYASADANQESGLHLFNSSDNIINIQAASAAGTGLLYEQKHAVSSSGFPSDPSERNIINIIADDGHTVGIISGNALHQDETYRNTVTVNQPDVEVRRQHTGIFWPVRGDGTEVVPPFRIGQNVSTSSTTPIWEFVIDFGTTDKSLIFQSWDGSDTRRFFRLSHTNDEVTLGDATSGEFTFPRFMSLSTGNLPAAGNAGRVVFNTTENELYFDDGSSWLAVGTGGGSHTHPADDITSGTFAGGGAYIFPTTIVPQDGVAASGRRISDFYGTLGSTSDEHFTFGKPSSGSSGNPYYTLVTNSSAVPRAHIQGYDGTTTQTFITMEYDTPKLVLGGTGMRTQILDELELNGDIVSAVTMQSTLEVTGGDITIRNVDGRYLSFEDTSVANMLARVGGPSGNLVFEADVNQVQSSTSMRWRIDDDEKMQLTAGGHLALGTTDVEAWAAGTAFQIGAENAIWSWAGNFRVLANAYYDGSFKYKTTDGASKVDMRPGGSIILSVAPSGTADTAISWTNALTVTNNGDLEMLSGKKLYLDGGGDTYIHHTTADRIDFVAGAGTRMDIGTGAITARVNLRPVTNNTRTLGTSSLRWATIYGVDLDLTGSALFAGKPFELKPANNTSPRLILERTETNITDNLALCVIDFKATDDSSGIGAMIITRADGAWSGSGGSRPTDFEIWTHNGSGFQTTVIESDGAIAIEAGSGDPSARSDHAHVYAKGATAEIWVQDEAANTTQLSPHDPETGEWIFYSENTKTGRRIRVRMEELVSRLVDEYGWDDIMEVDS